jgi:hypothetical protein
MLRRLSILVGILAIALPVAAMPDPGPGGSSGTVLGSVAVTAVTAQDSMSAFTPRAFMPLLALYLLKADRIPLRYGFRHHLIREVVLETLAPDERRRLHGKAGEYHEGAGAPSQLLAYHFRARRRSAPDGPLRVGRGTGGRRRMCV